MRKNTMMVLIPRQ